MVHGEEATAPLWPRSKVGLWFAIALIVVALATRFWLIHVRQGQSATPSAGLMLTLRVAAARDAGQETNNASFDSSGNLNLAGNKRFRLHVTATQPGHLYLINESMSGNRKTSEFVTLFPSPTANMSSSFLGAGYEITVPKESWLEIDRSPGVDTLWIVLSRTALLNLENISQYATSSQKGVVTKIEDREMLANFFKSKQDNRAVQTTVNNETVNLFGNNEMVVLCIKILNSWRINHGRVPTLSK